MRLAKKTLLGLPTDFIRLHPLALGYAHTSPGSPRIGERRSVKMRKRSSSCKVRADDIAGHVSAMPTQAVRRLGPRNDNRARRSIVWPSVPNLVR